MEPACPSRPRTLVGTPFPQPPSPAACCLWLPLPDSRPSCLLSVQPSRPFPPPASLARSFWRAMYSGASQGSLQLRPCVAHGVAIPVPVVSVCLTQCRRHRETFWFYLQNASDHLLPSCLPFPWARLSPGFRSVLGPQNLPVLAVLEPSEYPPPPSRLCLNLPWLTRCLHTLSFSE